MEIAVEALWFAIWALIGLAVSPILILVATGYAGARVTGILQ